MSPLRGRPRQTFLSEVEEAARTPEIIDIAQVNLDDYAAAIMAVKYTSLLLRCNEAPATSRNAG